MILLIRRFTERSVVFNDRDKYHTRNSYKQSELKCNQLKVVLGDRSSYLSIVKHAVDFDWPAALSLLLVSIIRLFPKGRLPILNHPFYLVQ